MDLGQPLRSLVPSLDAEVLTVLAGTTAPLTGNRVAGLAARGSRAGLMKVLDRLVAHGLVLSEPAGSANLYVLNREHLLCGPVLEAVAASTRLLVLIKTEIERWAVPCDYAAVFGSLSRGGATAASDIDLLLVRPPTLQADDDRWQQQLRGLELQVRRWTGNALSILELTGDDLARGHSVGERLLEELREQAVDLVGGSTRQLIEQATSHDQTTGGRAVASGA